MVTGGPVPHLENDSEAGSPSSRNVSIPDGSPSPFVPGILGRLDVEAPGGGVEESKLLNPPTD